MNNSSVCRIYFLVLNVKSGDERKSHLLVLWGEEARAHEDSAEPDIKITRWNSIPGMENMMRISSISIYLWSATDVELNSIRRSLCVIIVRALIYLN